MGACCLPNGNCVGPVSPETCSEQGGVFQGNATTCGSVTCPIPEGACCLGTTCFGPLTESDCEQGFGGVWQGPLSDCKSGSCAPACPADIAPSGGNGLVNIDDLTQVILNWGTNNAVADIDDDGVVEIDDLTAVILDWGTCS
jgi:hypothetical protein